MISIRVGCDQLHIGIDACGEVMDANGKFHPNVLHNGDSAGGYHFNHVN